MRKFKVGDKVRVLETGAHHADVTKGDVGYITLIHGLSGCPRVRMDDGENWYLPERYLEPVNESVTAGTTVDQLPTQTHTPSPAASILLEAAEIVHGTRNTTHGPKERSFQAIADLWNAYLKARKDPAAEISAVDMSWMMVLLKIARSVQGEAVRDHFVDAAGYAAGAGELAGC